MTVQTHFTRAVRAAIVLALLAGTAASAQQAKSDPPDAQRLDARLEAAFAINAVAEPAKAQAAFEQIRIDAERLGLTRQVAGALLGMASVESAQYRHANAKTLTNRALELYRLAGDEVGEARATQTLGNIANQQGQYDESLQLLARARDTFARLGMKHDLATTWYNYIYAVHDESRDGLIDAALAAARDAGDRAIECRIWHAYGDGLFMRGQFTAAFQALNTSLSCFEQTDQIADKGRVLVSLGRVERAHGQYERALAFYQQAYALQQQAHDEPAALQSLNAIGVANSYMGRYDEARKCYEEALARAKVLGSERYIAFLTGALGSAYANLGQLDRALELLQDALAREKTPIARLYRYQEVAGVLARLDRLDEARTAIDAAVALAEASEVPEEHAGVLAIRADIEQRMDQLEASDADLRKALDLLETLRKNTLAQDFMKRGYSEVTQAVFGAAIDVRTRRGDFRGALQIAEQARSRAFLDLLASRQLDRPDAVGMVASTARTVPQNGLPPGLLAAAAPTAASIGAISLPTRGGRGGSIGSFGGSASAGTHAIAPYLTAPTLDIASPRSAAAPTPDEMIATAARLRSTLLVYWVGWRSMVAWVVAPTGEIHAATINVDPSRLSDLARSTTNPLKNDGAALMLLGPAQRQPWRDLYDLLIKPVRAYLPAAAGSLVTVVPHGPLFQVSFAGLQDEQGKYLIESYRLHYTPSVGVLAYTVADAGPRRAGGAGTALLVGDPTPPASDPGDEALSDLPWARREVTEIGTLLGARRARVITASDATEAHVREQIEQADLLHFATHGVIRQSESMSSFLALARPAKADARMDGKLTADEVYGLRLHADLVVLSACDTALGPMSGDGVIGFTRAFLYAGARSVIATEWNVPDQTGYEVMRRFYRYRKAAAADTSDALREAQLSVLRTLRAGKLQVDTPGGKVALRENPLFWAGFVLVGKP